MGEGVLDGGESAVVHIGAAIGEIAERGRFEGSHVGIVLCFAVAAEVIQIAARIGANAQIVELVVGEKRVVFSDGVANGAIALLGADENYQASLAAEGSAFESWP